MNANDDYNKLVQELNKISTQNSQIQGQIQVERQNWEKDRNSFITEISKVT